MARINSNVAATIAQRHLDTSYKSLNSSLERLSTGLRINHGKDDPAGLIVSERLRSEISAVNQAIANTQRASTIIATTEGALDEVAALLRSIQEKIVEAANEGAISEDEIRANQLQIDSAVASITRIANSTTFAGRALLNGSLDYATSGVATSAIHGLAIHGAQFGTQAYIPVQVNVNQTADHAALYFPQSSLASSVTIEIQGLDGVTTLSFSSGAAASAIARAIQSVSDATGVSATLSSNPSGGFTINSRGFGTRAFATVRVLAGGGSFNLTDAGGNPQMSDNGRDATATINGALSVGDGNHLSLKTATLDLELDLDPAFGVTATSFAISGGGALFQVGPQVNTNLQVGIGVQSVAASNLGNSELGFLSQLVTGEDYSVVGRHYLEASKIVNEAIRQVSVMRGRLGAFEKNTLDTNVNQLGITMENLTSAESAVRDADFAFETSMLTRNQVLVSSGTSVLALANQTPQSVLRLLGG